MTVMVVALVLVWVVVGLLGWLGYQLVAQNGRLLLRLEELEQRRGVAPASEVASIAGLPVGSVLPDFELHLHGATMRLAPDRHAFVADGLQHLNALAYLAGARFYTDDTGQLMCDVRDVTAAIQGLEDIWILNEIFVVGVYRMIDDIVARRPVVVWDIGMNVGLASLYFATRPGVVAVVGHEPLAPTYQAALANLRLNPASARKITALDYGVGGTDRTELVDYCLAYKGSVGLRGLIGDAERRRTVLGVDETNTIFTKEALTMRAAHDVLASIRTAHPGMPVVAKIDCEGAEYEIIESLSDSGTLSTLDAVMMEWHRDRPDRLCERLAGAGFVVSRSDWPHTEALGMIYAVRDHSIRTAEGHPSLTRLVPLPRKP